MPKFIRSGTNAALSAAVAQESPFQGWIAAGFMVLVVSLPWVGVGCGPESPPIASNQQLDSRSFMRSQGEAEPPDDQSPSPSLVGMDVRGAATRSYQTVPQKGPSPFRFLDITAESGIDFVHVSGMTSDKHFPTANGSGVAVFDYDGDGWMDLYFCNATFFPLGSRSTGPNRLYRNLGGNRFEDVTSSSGLGFEGFCHGVVVGDFDNDGHPDVFLATYHQDRLYRNNGDGTFTDMTDESGILQGRWSSSGATLDYNNDGLLDIYVSTYGVWDMKDAERFCGDQIRRVRLYCSPLVIQPSEHMLYRNEGNFKFTNVYNEFLVDLGGNRIPGRTDGRGFGVVAIDVDRDGDVDLYIANDICPNFLFLNRGDGTFEDVTELSGAAYDEKGQAQSGMGVEANDCNGDGRPELFVTNFANEYNTLYQNMGGGSFQDMTTTAGLATASLPWVGWGCVLEDFDRDGWIDCFVSNGHVDNNRDQIGQKVDYAQPPLLFHNTALDEKSPDSPRRFELATLQAGSYFESSHVGRGVAYGDLDNDGRLDLVINHKDDKPAVLLNRTESPRFSWLQLKLVGTQSNRDAVGAKVEIQVGSRTLTRWRKGGTSMLSSHDPRMIIGLGTAETETVVVEVTWPKGTVSRHELRTNQYHEIVEP